MKPLKMRNQRIVYIERKDHGTTKFPFTPKIYLDSMN